VPVALSVLFTKNDCFVIWVKKEFEVGKIWEKRITTVQPSPTIEALTSTLWTYREPISEFVKIIFQNLKLFLIWNLLFWKLIVNQKWTWTFSWTNWAKIVIRKCERERIVIIFKNYPFHSPNKFFWNKIDNIVTEKNHEY